MIVLWKRPAYENAFTIADLAVHDEADLSM
jgi:hypothetical protein